MPGGKVGRGREEVRGGRDGIRETGGHGGQVQVHGGQTSYSSGNAHTLYAQLAIPETTALAALASPTNQ